MIIRNVSTYENKYVPTYDTVICTYLCTLFFLLIFTLL